MKLTSPSGKIFNLKNPKKYLIGWDKKSRSEFQFKTKKFLETYWKRHIVFEEFPIPKTKMTIDIFNFSKNIAVEVQGSQHLSYNKFFHGNTNYKYLQQLKRDQYKFDFCNDFGIILIEIYSLEELTEDFFSKNGVIL
jgi:hypothetical protein